MEKGGRDGLEQKVLDDITPSSAEMDAIQSAVAGVVSDVETYVRLNFPSVSPVDPIVVGSVAKGTCLKDPDVDIFMLFPMSVTRGNLEKMGIAIGKAVLQEPVLKYAEHPYVRGKRGKTAIDLVPCYRIEDPSKKMSAVDRTPFHTVYVNGHASSKQKDEIRLLKRFFKGIGVYGADARIRGFSGYLCELLVLSLGDFRGVLMNMADWSPGAAIMPPEASLGSKLGTVESSIVVPDPVDSDRNVAAALDRNSFTTAVIAARHYLEKPSITFFYPAARKLLSLAQLKKISASSGHGLLMVTFPKPDITDDNLYPQIVKAKKSIAALLEKYGFDVNRSTYLADDDIRVLFEMKNGVHPSFWLRTGPPGWAKTADSFISKHRKHGGSIVVVDGVLYSEEAREFDLPEKLLKAMLDELSTGADLDRLKSKTTVVAGSDVLVEENKKILSELLAPAFPWE